MKGLRCLLILFIAGIVLGAVHCYAETADFGVVMDFSGEVTIKRNKVTIPVDLGVNIITGDIIILYDKARTAIISYRDCIEWNLVGPKRILVKGGTIVADEKPLPYSRRLPVCYSTENINKAGSEPVGGFVLRGPKDPLSDLRTEFNSGKASNSTVMILLMHELNRGEIEKARPYYEFLRNHVPESEFITRLKPVFK